MQQNSPFQPIGGMVTQGQERFRFPNYTIRRKVLRLIGASFFVDDPSGQVVLFGEQKGFKLKEDLRLFTGEDKTQELVTIKARTMLDFGAAYDVWDTPSGQKLDARESLRQLSPENRLVRP